MQAVFERTLMTPNQLEDSLIEVRKDQTIPRSQVLEHKVFIYLSQCYVRACNEADKVRPLKHYMHLLLLLQIMENS